MSTPTEPNSADRVLALLRAITTAPANVSVTENALREIEKFRSSAVAEAVESRDRRITSLEALVVRMREALAEVDSLRARLAVADAALASVRESFTYTVTHDRIKELERENAALREALTEAQDVLEAAMFVAAKVDFTLIETERAEELLERAANVFRAKAALHPATKEGKAE